MGTMPATMMRFLKSLAVRKRLVLATTLGVATAVLLPAPYQLITRVLLGWNVLAYVYLVALWVLIARARPQHIRSYACQQDESARVVLALVCAAAAMSLAAIILEMAIPGGNMLSIWSRVAITLATITSSWFLLPTAFAVHYAHCYYLAPVEERPLVFPEEPEEPTYWDFAYFAFTIAVASQTADVSVRSAAMRRVVLAQSMLSFVFNTSLVALMINIAAGVLHP